MENIRILERRLTALGQELKENFDEKEEQLNELRRLVEKQVNSDPDTAKKNEGYMVFRFGAPEASTANYARFWRSVGKDILHLSKSESATVCTTFLIFAETPARFEIRLLALDSYSNINIKVEYANSYKSSLEIHRKMRDDFASENLVDNDCLRWKVSRQ